MILAKANSLRKTQFVRCEFIADHFVFFFCCVIAPSIFPSPRQTELDASTVSDRTCSQTFYHSSYPLDMFQTANILLKLWCPELDTISMGHLSKAEQSSAITSLLSSHPCPSHLGRCGATYPWDSDTFLELALCTYLDCERICFIILLLWLLRMVDCMRNGKKIFTMLFLSFTEIIAFNPLSFVIIWIQFLMKR